MTSPAAAIRGAVESVTRDWSKQRKAEERHANAVHARRSRLIRSTRVTIKDAAFQVVEEAYTKASGTQLLPVNPRQIFYAARRSVLVATGVDSLESGYFLQTLLPAYMEDYDCDDWDLVWDARGHFREPHTRRVVPIGTLQVRQYLGERPEVGDALEVKTAPLYPTQGPEHRYGTVVFVEKEGFDPIIAASRLAERFDVAPMSTKGMSTTAARLLIDRLFDRGVRKFLVLHDFDISGFSIFGTLGKSSNRYRFRNKVELTDIGLRLTDVEGLLSEPFTDRKKNPLRVAGTLRRHGASQAEIDFLIRQRLPYRGFEGARVELNAMTNDELIAFIERKFAEHGVQKVIPDDKVLEQHARRCITQRLTADALKKINGGVAKRVRATKLPDDLRWQVEALLQEQAELPWDLAVAQIIVGGEQGGSE